MTFRFVYQREPPRPPPPPLPPRPRNRRPHRLPAGFGTGFVDVQRTAIHFHSVELCDSRLGIAFFRHFHKRESTGLTAVAVRYDINSFDAAILRESLLQDFLGGLVAQITDKNICHSLISSFRSLSGLHQAPERRMGGRTRRHSRNREAGKDSSMLPRSAPKF